MQVDWLYQEIQKPEYVYQKNDFEKYTVFDFLHRDESLLEMTKAVMRGYEKPWDQSDIVALQRASWGKNILDRNTGSSPDADPTPTPEPTPKPKPISSCAITVPELKYGDKDWYKGGDKGVAVAICFLDPTERSSSVDTHVASPPPTSVPQSVNVGQKRTV